MIAVDRIGEIRRAYFGERLPIKEIVRQTELLLEILVVPLDPPTQFRRGHQRSASARQRRSLNPLGFQKRHNLLLPDKVWRITWDANAVHPRFAYSLLRSDALRSEFAKVASGTSDSMKNISQAKLVAIEVPIPPLPLQKTFAEQARRIEAAARALDAAAAKAQALAAGLSAEVFGAGERKEAVTADGSLAPC